MDPYGLAWSLYQAGYVGFLSPEDTRPECLNAGYPPIVFLQAAPYEQYLLPLMLFYLVKRRLG